MPQNSAIRGMGKANVASALNTLKNKNTIINISHGKYKINERK